MPKKDGYGRFAIRWLKEQYRAGVEFVSSAAMRDAIVDAGGHPRTTMGLAAAWDRQARYELAEEEGEFITQPRAVIGYLRTPKASPAVRRVSQDSAHRELATRARNQRVIANAAADQIDASPNEIRKAKMIEIAANILSEVVALEE